MRRNAGARVKLWCVVAALAALVAACDDDEPVAGDGGTAPARDASPDAPTDSGPGGDDDGGGPPWSGGDSGIIGNVDDQFCVLRVTAECDGREDCDGAACCARFEPTEVSFTAMECAPPGENCDYMRTFPLCHDGQFCAAGTDDNFTCRTSVLIPGDFIGVCLPPSGFLPSQPPTSKEVAGLIACGSNECVVGEEQCCMREGFDLRSGPLKYEPYCAPIGTPCDCTEPSLPPPDDDAGL